MVNLLFVSEAFRLHPASIATMAESTLSFLIFAYFLSLRNKTKDTWLMVGFVGLAMLVYLVDIGVTSSTPPLYIYFRASHAILLSVWTLFWTWCVYTYRGNPLRREAVVVIVIEGFLLGGMIVGWIFPGITIINLTNAFPIYYVIIGLHVWSILVLLRKSVIASRSRKDAPGTMQSHPLNLVERPARSLRAFALLFGCWLTFLIWTFIRGSAFSWHISQMILLLGVLVVHLNYASEVTTFRVKLVSLPLATTLALLGILPFLLFGVTSPEDTWNIIDTRLQEQLSVFAWLIPSSTAFILISFILFYWVGLLKPLNRLLMGVHRIEAGNLQAPVPIFNQDEIGYLANSLNRMATSLKESHDELEKRVTDRTAELQATLIRLQATQTQLIQKEKLASLGELTAGIAHEIQNPLNFVNNFSEVSEELCGEIEEEAKAGNTQEILSITADLKQNLEKIHHHGKRADSIVKGMLQHSRASSGEKQLTDLNKLADEYLRLSYHGMRAKDKEFNASLVTDFDDKLDKVEVVPQELGRVLLNLFNNAFYAIQEKKKVMQNGYLPEVKVSTKAVGNQVEICIRDNGTGVPEVVKQKIFQPFFTTKPTGEGTGLGLSLSYDIITKGHGGEMKVESKEGEGTEFIISLPMVDSMNTANNL